MCYLSEIHASKFSYVNASTFDSSIVRYLHRSVVKAELGFHHRQARSAVVVDDAARYAEVKLSM